MHRVDIGGRTKLHRVVNRKPRGHHTPRRVDVHADLFLRVVSLKKEQLRHHQARDRVVDRARDEEDAFLEQPRIDVVATVAAVGLFDHHRDKIVHISVHHMCLRAS